MKNCGLGKQLNQARKLTNSSLALVSKETKINVTTLSRIEKGLDFHATTGAKIILWIEKALDQREYEFVKRFTKI